MVVSKWSRGMGEGVGLAAQCNLKPGDVDMTRRLLPYAMICLMVLAFSCSGDRTVDTDGDAALVSSELSTPEEKRYAERGTLDEAVTCMMLGYDREHLAAYGSVLDDEFRFQFLPEVAESLGLPPGEPWWGKVEDLSSTQNMFEASTVTNVNASLVRMTSWSACTDPVTGREGMCARFEPDIMVVIEESGQEPIILWVNQTWIDVIAVRDQQDEGLWCILALEEIAKPFTVFADTRIRSLTTEGTSWGDIKALFR
jgi:hypothetical protein